MEFLDPGMIAFGVELVHRLDNMYSALCSASSHLPCPFLVCLPVLPMACLLPLAHRLPDSCRTGQRPKTVLSQRDVPGLTAAAVPTLLAAGIRAISVGVNGGSTPPNVPKVFTWALEGGPSIRAMWLQGGYGGIGILPGLFDYTSAPGLAHALVVGMHPGIIA